MTRPKHGDSSRPHWVPCDSPEDLYFDVLGPAMRRVGDDWATGRLDVADEHRVTVVMYRLVGRLGPLFARRGTTRGAIVLGAPVGDPHGLATALVADPLRGPRLLDHRSRRQHARRLVGEHHRRHAAHRRSRRRRLDTRRRRTHRHNHRHNQGPSRRALVILGGVAIRDQAHAIALGGDTRTTSAREAVDHFDATT